MNVAIRHSPSGYSSSGPRSTSPWPWSMNAGATMKPRAGSVTMPPITAPRPSVDAARNVLRPYRSSSSPAAAGGTAGAAQPAGLRRRRLRRRRLQAGTDVGGGVADPERAEGERQDRAEDDDAPADDEAEQEDGDADGESDRPELGGGTCGLWSRP